MMRRQRSDGDPWSPAVVVFADREPGRTIEDACAHGWSWSCGARFERFVTPDEAIVDLAERAKRN